MGWRAKLKALVQQEWFRRLYASIGIVMIVLSFAILVEPEPFLQFGYLGVFGFNLFGPGTLLIPRLAMEMNILGLAASSAAGMAINDSLSWVVGYGGRAIIKPGKRTERVSATIKRYGVWALLLYSIAPFPFDFVGLIAGYLRFPYLPMLAAAFMGKMIRFTLMGVGTNWLVRLF